MPEELKVQHFIDGRFVDSGGRYSLEFFSETKTVCIKL